MARKVDIGIELDRDRTVLAVFTPDGEERYTFETQIGVGNDGIVVGNEANSSASHRVFERHQIEFGTDAEGEDRVSTLLLTLFLERVVETVRERIEAADTEAISINSASISLPSSASQPTYDAVREAASAVGLEGISIQRRPTPETVPPLRQAGDGSTALSVTIGAEECGLAVYRIEDGDIVVLGRLVIPELGARSWSREIAETVLERIGAEEDARVEYSRTSLNELARVIQRDARNAGTDLIEGGDLSIHHDMSRGASLTVGEHTLSEDVMVDHVIDRDMRYEALECFSDTLVGALGTLFKRISIDTAGVDLVIGSGDGYTLDVIHETITGFVDSDPEFIFEGPLGAGAKRLARRESDQSKTTEALAYIISVYAATADGIEQRSLGPVQPPIENPRQFELEPASTSQTRGRFTIGFTPPGSDGPSREFTVRLYGIPPASGEDPVTIPLEVSVGTAVDVSENDIDIRVDDTTLAKSVDVDTGSGAAGSDSPPLCFPGHESKTFNRNKASPDYATQISPVTEAVENIETSDIARAVHEIRADLWQCGIAEERSLDPSEIEILLREFDQRLSRYDIEFFVPDLGSTPQPGRHEIRKQEPADAEEGAIIEVLKPGMEIDGRRAEPAVVTIASDATPSSDNDQAESGSGSQSSAASMDDPD